MTQHATERTVGELVTEQPGRSRLFSKLGIDFCCGGGKTLEQACREHALDPAEVARQLADVDDTSGEQPQTWETLAALCDHIVSVHHAFLYDELPRLEGMLAKVAKVHGDRFGYMIGVHEVFAALSEELLTHMRKEEQVLFPMIQSLERGALADPSAPIRVMEREHDDAGAALERLRALTGGYAPPEGACNTFRAALGGLEALEAELHQHIHEENNILHPRALELAGGMPR